MKTTTLKAPPVKKRKKAQAKILAGKWPAFYEWKQNNREVLALPLAPNLANSRMHWRAKHAAKTQYFGECETLFQSYLIPAPEANPLTRKVKKRVRVTMFVKLISDHDNATARLKWSLDFLVRNNYLWDDSPEWCELLMPVQMKANGTPERVEIEIEAL